MYKNKKEKVNVKRKIDIPQEIFLKILEEMESIQDLINMYDIFKEYRHYIINSIYDYCQIFKSGEHYLYKFLERFYELIDTEYIIGYEEDKDYIMKTLKHNYNNHIIYRIIIESLLKCYKCKYIFDINKIKHIYFCMYCYEYFCGSCCIKCDICYIYHDEEFRPQYHCSSCGNKCLHDIEKNFKKSIIKKDEKKN